MSVKEAARKFEFIREIASGGFGSVYLAKVIHADGFSRLVAIKLLHRKWSENVEVASRMRDEARLLGWLRHRNIVDVIDLTVIDGRSAIVMEYLDAADARQLVDRCIQDHTRIPLRVALEVCAAAAAALDAAYNRPPYAGEKPLRVIHRDIKPSNIMIDSQGLVKVCDFGVARAEFDAREAKTAELSFGSLEYMPPERLFFEPESPSSDIYSLGATLFEMLALQKLGKAKLRQSEQERFLEERFEDLVELHPMPTEDAEDLLHDLLRDMLAFDESDRPTAADAVVKMRSFARQLDGVGVEEWSEQAVPPVVQEARDAVSPSKESLVGSVITEDVSSKVDEPTLDRSLGGSDAFPDLDADTILQGPPLFAQGKPDTQALLRDDDDMEGSEHSRGRDDERWSALKQATLASLTETGELGPRTVQAVRQVAGFADPGAAVEDEGETMVIRDVVLPGDETVTAPGMLLGELPDPPASMHTEKTIVQKEIPRGAPPGQPEAGGGGRAAVAVLVVVTMILGSIAGLLVLVLVVGLAMQRSPSGMPVPKTPNPAPVVAPVAPVAPAPAPAPAPVPEGAAVFEVPSEADIRRISVTCGPHRDAAPDRVVVVAEHLSQGCTVLGVDNKRARHEVELKEVEGRVYTCFANGDRCE